MKGLKILGEDPLANNTLLRFNFLLKMQLKIKFNK